jgi:hypothetical protein
MWARLRFHSQRWLPSALSLMLAMCALALDAEHARADTEIGVDLDYGLGIDTVADGGGGFALRLGQQLHIPAIALTPEIAFGYHSFSGGGEPAIYSGLGGVRLGFGEIFRLGPFAHLGLGHIDYDLPGDPNDTAFQYDLGAFFDLTILPLVNIGVHGAYNELRAGDTGTFQWATFGAHVELIL